MSIYKFILTTLSYNNSLGKALQTLYPEKEWYMWKFSWCPRGFWLNQRNCRQYFNWLADELGIESHTDWYKITYNTISDNYGRGLVDAYGQSPTAALENAFPGTLHQCLIIE